MGDGCGCGRSLVLVLIAGVGRWRWTLVAGVGRWSLALVNWTSGRSTLELQQTRPEEHQRQTLDERLVDMVLEVV